MSNASTVVDPVGAGDPAHAGSGALPAMDFERAGWIMRRAQRLWLGIDDAEWIAAVQQAEAEWCLMTFLWRR